MKRVGTEEEKKAKKRKDAATEKSVAEIESHNKDQDIQKLSLVRDKDQDTREHSLVWCKLAGYPKWPAITIDAKDISQTDEPNKVWLLWLGDHRISKMPTLSLAQFSTFATQYNDKSKNTGYRRAVEEAIDIAMSEVGGPSNIKTLKDKIDWAKRKCKDPIKLSTLPEALELVLKQVRTANSKEKTQEKNVNLREEMQNECESESDEVELENFSHIKDKLERVCISCLEPRDGIESPHPLFMGTQCQDCKKRTMSRIFLNNTKGIGKFCCVCVNKERNLIYCVTCLRSYCRQCIIQLCKPGALEIFKESQCWKCFLCTNIPECGLLEKREAWENNLMRLYQEKVPESVNFKGPKRKMRVLSVYDGVGAGKLVLDKMGFQVDVYYASESNEDATTVSYVNNNVDIQQIGEPTKLKETDIRNTCPIDLLIGVSPLNITTESDLKGTKRSLQEFFEFLRIKKTISKYNKESKFFWLYGNIASLTEDSRNCITRHLGCQPYYIDTSFFSSQIKRLLVWGNVPHIGRFPQTSVMQDISVMKDTTVPHPHSGRTAKVTIDSSSLGQPILPALTKKKEESNFCVTEVESVKGFPPHFTDTCNLSPTQRLLLLNSTWGVHELMYLLKPLKKWFKNIDN